MSNWWKPRDREMRLDSPLRQDAKGFQTYLLLEAMAQSTKRYRGSLVRRRDSESCPAVQQMCWRASSVFRFSITQLLMSSLKARRGASMWVVRLMMKVAPRRSEEHTSELQSPC